MLKHSIAVRPAQPSDVPDLIKQMRLLAEFEEYIDEFKIDEKSLLERAFGDYPECYIFVAVGIDGIVGYAVGLIIPFTYDLRPTIILKELFVDARHRGKGFGAALLHHVAAWTLAQGGARLKWDVMAGNHRAEVFYKQHGGSPDSKWVPYIMDNVGLKEIMLSS